MTMIPSWQKEELSRAYISALISRAGYTIGNWSTDKDGVDVTLRDGGITVDIQLKCTTSPKTLSKSRGYTYQLDTPTYDKLRGRDRSAPGYLAIIVAPPSLDDWLICEPKRLLLACHAYWAKIQDRNDPATGKSKSITLPISQRLDVHSLGNMFNFSLQMVRRAG